MSRTTCSRFLQPFASPDEPVILRETAEGTSYQMVRSVFRPFLQAQRTICPSVSRQASTRVSPDFASFSSMVHHLPVVQTQRNTDTHHRHTQTDTGRHRHKQGNTDTDTNKETQTQTRKHRHKKKQNRKHFYSRRWSWPSFHRCGSSDPALRRHAHCGTRPATYVLVSPQGAFGGTQTAALSPPPLLPLSRDLLSGHGSGSAQNLSVSVSEAVSVTEIDSQNPGI